MIPFNNLQRHQLMIADKVRRATDKVLKSGWYILGNEVVTFEQ